MMHAGKPCPDSNEIQLLGHSIECRINAEDPSNNFLPFPGKITSFHMPGGKGVRYHFLGGGYEVVIPGQV